VRGGEGDRVGRREQLGCVLVGEGTDLVDGGEVEVRVPGRGLRGGDDEAGATDAGHGPGQGLDALVPAWSAREDDGGSVEAQGPAGLLTIDDARIEKVGLDRMAYDRS